MSNEGQVSKKQEVSKKKSTLVGVIFSNAGNNKQPIYKRVYDKENDVNLVKKTGVFDIYDFIQASRSQTDLALLYKRFNELGEVPNYDPNASDVDFVNMPHNIHEVYDMVNDINGNFNRLPKSIQEIFGSPDAYMKSLMNGSYQATLLNAINEKVRARQAEEKKEGN